MKKIILVAIVGLLMSSCIIPCDIVRYERLDRFGRVVYIEYYDECTGLGLERIYYNNYEETTIPQEGTSKQ